MSYFISFYSFYICPLSVLQERIYGDDGTPARGAPACGWWGEIGVNYIYLTRPTSVSERATTWNCPWTLRLNVNWTWMRENIEGEREKEKVKPLNVWDWLTVSSLYMLLTLLDIYYECFTADEGVMPQHVQFRLIINHNLFIYLQL